MQPSVPEKSWILITGASSGIGRACARRLHAAEFRVIAAVRKQADALSLQQETGPGLHTVFLDVTDSSSIQNAAAQVAALTGGRLSGLLNNAGIAFGGPLEMLPPEDIQSLVNINIVGVLTVTRTFLPILRQARGTVINMGSTSGIVALPCLSAYAASKFALKGLSDALRLELMPLGVGVCLLEIGNVETPIWGKGLDVTRRHLSAAPPAVAALYEPLIELSEKLAVSSPKIAPERVARIVQKILQGRRPRACYHVGPDVWLMKMLACIPRGLRCRLFGCLLPRYGRS